MAVKATSGLDNKDALGYKLKELGDWTRDVKDTMTSLNAKGINSFSWILHEVRCIPTRLFLSLSHNKPETHSLHG